MNKSNQITADDAKAALASIEAANKTTENSMKPPLWLILLFSISFGIKTTAIGLMINNSLWQCMQWGSFIVCCFSVLAWIVTLRAKGITIKIKDVNITRKGIISALLICTLLVLSRVIYLQTGSILFPCIAGIFNALIMAFSFHFGRLFNVKEKEVNNG